MRSMFLFVLIVALLTTSLSASKVCFPQNTRCDKDFLYLQSCVQEITEDQISFKLRYSKDLKWIKRIGIFRDTAIQKLSDQLSFQGKKLTGLDGSVKNNSAEASEKRKLLLQRFAKENKNLRSRLDVLEKFRDQFQAEVTRLTAENSAQKDELIKTSQIVVKAEAKLEGIDRRLTSLQKQNQLISFSAYVTPSITSISRYVPIPFHGVLNNAGGGYSPNGTFTAPVAGTYHFYCTLLLKDYGEAFIYVDGSVKGRTLAGGGGKEHGLEMAGNSFIIHLRRGAKVHVALHWDKKTHYVHHLWSTFSGFLIQAD